MGDVGCRSVCAFTSVPRLTSKRSSVTGEVGNVVRATDLDTENDPTERDGWACGTRRRYVPTIASPAGEIIPFAVARAAGTEPGAVAAVILTDCPFTVPRPNISVPSNSKANTSRRPT